MEKMRKFNFTPNGYKEYLKKLCEFYTFSRNVPLHIHELLVLECMNGRVKCPDYLNRLM